MREPYLEMWILARFTRLEAARGKVVRKALEHKNRYRLVEAVTGVPWEVVAAIHSLESNASFSRHLHNGDPLRFRTTHVPKGRPRQGKPPFGWVESAVDALTYSGLTRNKDWTVVGTLAALEGYNGLGYQKRNLNSPYLWSGTNYYESGKYVADGKFDPNAVSKQVGAVPILKELGFKGR